MAVGYEAMIRKGRYAGPVPEHPGHGRSDGSAADIGIGVHLWRVVPQPSALFICYDNECYANTGIQVLADHAVRRG